MADKKVEQPWPTLFGDYNPAGRLPITFYKSVDQLPDFQDYSMKGRTYRYMTQTPLYPFGYGLSYTTFAVNSMKLDQNSFTKGGKITVTAEVENTGKVDGETVIQMYTKLGRLKRVGSTRRGEWVIE